MSPLKRRILSLLIAFAAVLGARGAWAKSTPKILELFDPNGAPVAGYRELLDSLQDGDVLCFNGCRERFEFVSRLGHGYTTQIFRVRDDRGRDLALRVPISEGSTDYQTVRHVTPFVNYIDYFVRGHRQLRSTGIRMPAIYSFRSQQFVAVERIGFEFTLDDFLGRPDTIPPKVLRQAEEQLYRFAEKVALFERIGDFGARQLVYSERLGDWVLLDMTDDSRPLSMVFGRQQPDEHPLESAIYRYATIYNRDKVPEHLRERAQKIEKEIEKRIAPRAGLKERLLFQCQRLLIRSTGMF